MIDGTPETDDQIGRVTATDNVYHPGEHVDGVPASFARGLETQRNQLKAALDKALDENLAMRSAIKQFRAAKGRHNTEIAARRILEMEIN